LIRCGCLAGFLALLWASVFYSTPTRAKVSIIAPHYITSDTTWTEANSPYLVDSFVIVNPGVTLTIEPGVVVDGVYVSGYNYLFEVDGKLLALGTAEKPILFHNTIGQWSGIGINGTAVDFNQGSDLEYVILDGGGLTGSGTAANLALSYAEADVHHCQFNNSPGDGILGDDASAQGVANIYDSSFTDNVGYAVNFEDGSVNPVLSNLTASGNGALLPYGGDLVVVNDATLHGAHIWENMGLPYLILGTTVGSDGMLTIEPGVEVLAQPGNDALDVWGTLFAEGTAGEPIHFYPADLASGWSGIAIMGTEGYPSGGGWFNYVTIAKGGFTGGSCDLYLLYGNATVTNSQLVSSQDSGVCLDHGATLVMTDTQLMFNQAYAIDVIDAGTIFILDNLYATGNLSDTIGVEGGVLSGVHTWSKSGINTYDLFYSAVTISTTGTLNIEPGVTVLFGETRDITIRGTLNAIGTPTNPITFTGETPTPGLWAGLNFVGTPEQHAVGRFAYATIEYGGYGGSAMVSLENADVSFVHCILRYCSHDAINILPGKSLAALPASQAVFYTAAAQPAKVNWSSLDAINGYAIHNGSSQAVLAAYNWWGAADGPTADDNPGGTGSALNGPVLYRPYLDAPDSKFIFMPLAIKP
jgi:hypothetical protein